MLGIETAKVFEPLLQPCTVTKECSRSAPRRRVPDGPLAHRQKGSLGTVSCITCLLLHDHRNQDTARSSDLVRRLKMWRYPYETKVFDKEREAVGRGPTPRAARDAALKRWNEQIEQWKEQNAESK